jgi:hypothetical protein
MVSEQSIRRQAVQNLHKYASMFVHLNLLILSIASDLSSRFPKAVFKAPINSPKVIFVFPDAIADPSHSTACLRSKVIVKVPFDFR